jgi:hypothetical protein
MFQIAGLRAKLAGEKALIEFLDRLGHEEGNVL